VEWEIVEANANTVASRLAGGLQDSRRHWRAFEATTREQHERPRTEARSMLAAARARGHHRGIGQRDHARSTLCAWPCSGAASTTTAGAAAMSVRTKITLTCSRWRNRWWLGSLWAWKGGTDPLCRLIRRAQLPAVGPRRPPSVAELLPFRRAQVNFEVQL